DSARGLRRVRGAEDRNRRITVGLCAVTARRQIAEHLIVGSILTDDVDDVFERRSAAAKDRSRLTTEKSRVSHNGLGIPKQLPLAANVHKAYTAREARR